MKHFAVVQRLIRTGLAGDRREFERSVRRLCARLEKENDTKSVETIKRLLDSATQFHAMEPISIELSHTQAARTTLTPGTNPPFDRETGGRLCDIHFPENQINQDPIYEGAVGHTVAEMLAEWSNLETLKKFGVEPTWSLLIFGPPGSGKTMTARHISKCLKLPMVVARIDGLVSSFLGTTARNIANLFDFANRHYCLLLLDEFDALAKMRDDPQEIGEIKRVVNTLLQNLDARRHHGLTIAITNHDTLLDRAVWRRFETHLAISEPGGGAREAMIKRFLAPVDASPDLIHLLSYCLNGESAGDIERICNALKRTLAIEKISPDANGIFLSLHKIATRLPAPSSQPMQELASGVDAFLRHATNDPNLKLTQASLGRISDRDQSRISRLKRRASEFNNGDQKNA